MYKKTLLLVIIFSIIILTFGLNYFKGGDYSFHLNKTTNECNGTFFENDENNSCEKYAPLFHFLSKIFSFHENAFFYFTILLFCIISPIIIFYYTKNYYSTLLYFFGSNYILYFLDGIFVQGLANILLFVLFFTKNKQLEIILLPLLILSHGSGFLAGLFLLLLKKIDLNGWLCSSLFLNNKPGVLYERIGSSGGLDLGVNNILHFFTKTFPFPFLLISLKQTWGSDKRYFWTIIFVSLMGYFYATRVWYLVFLLSIPAITSFFEKSDKKMKILLIFLVLLIGLWQFYLFYNYKNYC